jgi:hypothetical protein
MAVTLLALAVTGCVTMSVASHLDRDANFAQFRTWDWGPADALPTGDPRLDNNPFFVDHLEGAVEKQMSARGFMRVAPGETPDLRVHYHANINHRFEVNGVDRDRGYSTDQVQVVEYEQGTLVIDMVDTRTNKVVWRGWAQDSVQGMIDNQGRMEKQIDEAVTKMMKLFPAKSL